MSRPRFLLLLIPLLVVVTVAVTLGWDLFAPAAVEPAGVEVAQRQAQARALRLATGTFAGDRRSISAKTVRDLPTEGSVDDHLLRGVVLGPEERPVAAATVSVLRRAGDSYNLLDSAHNARRLPVAEAVTDERGCFAVRLSPGYPYLVVAEAPGFPRTWALDCRVGTHVAIRLERGVVLVGRVTDGDGEPVAAVLVRGGQDVPDGVAGPGELFRGTTDVDGRYRFENLRPGATWLRFHPRRHSSPRRIQLILPAGTTTTRDLTLLPGQTIHGRVIDAVTGQPVAGAQVGESALKCTLTDASGRYVLDGFSQEHVEIEVLAKGYSKVERRVRDRFGEPVSPRQDFELRPGRRARGRIVDPSGAGVAGAYVAAVATDFGPEGKQRLQRVDWRPTATGADGSFVIDGLRVDMVHVLFVKKEGFASLVYDFPGHEQRELLVEVGTVTLDWAATISGVVVDENGKGVARLKVELCGWNHDRLRMAGRFVPRDGDWLINGYVATRETWTDAAGRFWFTDLAAGSFTAQTQLPGQHKTTKLEHIIVPRGELVEGVRLAVRLGRTIAGRVEAGDGGTLPKVYISIDPTYGAQSSGDAEVNSDGTFSLGGLEPGLYRLTAYPYVSREEQARGRRLRTTVVEDVPAGRQDVLIRLRPGR